VQVDIDSDLCRTTCVFQYCSLDNMLYFRGACVIIGLGRL